MSHARPVHTTVETTVNIAMQLPEMARRQPDTLAVAFPVGRESGGGTHYERLTYRQLDRMSDQIAAGLVEMGIGPGVRTVLMVRPGLEFFTLVFALFKARAVMVCVDPGMGVKNLGGCLAEAEPEAFIGIGKAHLARGLLGWARRTVRHKVWVGDEVWKRRLAAPGSVPLAAVARRGAKNIAAGDRSLSTAMAGTRGDEMAAILFTSGSTGAAKGVVYTHANFTAQVEALRMTYDIRPGEIDLCTFPLFALFAPALGMSAIIPEMDFTRPGSVDPENIIDAVTRFSATNLFGSPALLDRVGRFGEAHNVSLPTLRRVISAGAPVPARVLARITPMLPPGTEIFTPYGATESLPVCSIGSNEILGETAALTDQGRGVCVGKPAGEAEVRIITITDEPIGVWSDDLLAGEGEVGEIVACGPAVTASYYNRPESNRLAKIRGSDGQLFHRMGDLGYFDRQGRVWFCGRKSQRVKHPNGDLLTGRCEGVFNAHPNVFRSALVDIGQQQAKPAICIEVEQDNPPADRAVLHEELLQIAARHGHTQTIRHILFHPGFPTDIRHNAKIGREQLATWARRKLG